MKLELIVLMTVAMGEILSVASQDCPPFGRLKFGRVKYRSRRKIAKFRCRRNYKLHGAKISICLRGVWKHPAPVCIAPGCEIPDPPTHLIMTPSKKDALLTLECLPQYQIQGPKSIYCDGTNWSHPISTCLYVDPALTCDFENSDLCGWWQYKGDDFDWTVNSRKTSTGRTGPDNDHTFGLDDEGHYLYMESSSPRSEGDVATVVSPSYRGLPNGTCFEFYYHMKGRIGPNEVGSLFVYVQHEEQDIQDLVPSFNVSEHQSDDWLRGSFEIGDVSSSIQIVISGIRGKSYEGDIAIDDVRLYNCSDYVDDVTTESEQDTTMQWTTDIPTSMSPDDTTSFPTLITTDVTDDTPTTNTLVTFPDHVTTSSDADVSTPPSVSYTMTMLSSTSPDVVDTTTESSTTETITMEMTSKSITSVKTPAPTTAVVSTTATTTSSTPRTTTTTTAKATTTVGTTERPSTTTTTTPTTTTTTPTTTTTTPTTTTTTRRSTTTTTPTTTTTMMTTTIPTSTKPTTKKATTQKQTTTPLTSTVYERKSTSPPTTTTTTPPATTTTETTTRKTTSMASTSTVQSTTNSVATGRISNTSTSSTARPVTTTTVSENAIPEVTTPPQDNNETDIPNVIKVGKQSSQSKGPIKPLMIGVGVGVAIGLAIVLVIVFLYMKKHRKKHDDMEDEMAPIARNAYSEW